MPGHFDDGVRALFEIETGVRGAAADRDPVIADAFAGGLQFAVESRAGFEHQDGGALSGGFLGKQLGMTGCRLLRRN